MLKDLKPDAEMEGWVIDENGVTHQSKADYLYCQVLPSCGCGDPASIGKYVQESLRKYVKQTGQALNDWSNVSYDDLPAMFFLSWADREGYIEHGTTIRCSWMTDKGNELLRDIAEVQKEELENEAKT